MKVIVTRADINNGRPKSETCCPVARALNRSVNFEQGISIRVNPTSIHVVDARHKSWRTVLLPDTAQEFIKQFDKFPENGPVRDRLRIQPIEFDLEYLPIPEPEDNGFNFTLDVDCHKSFDEDSAHLDSVFGKSYFKCKSGQNQGSLV